MKAARECPTKRMVAGGGGVLRRGVVATNGSSSKHSSLHQISVGGGKRHSLRQQQQLLTKQLVFFFLCLIFVAQLLIGAGVRFFNDELLLSANNQDLLAQEQRVRRSVSAPWRTPPARRKEKATKYFVFEEPKMLMAKKGVSMTNVEQDYELKVRQHIQAFLCAKANETDSIELRNNKQRQLACTREFQVFKCLTCTSTTEQQQQLPSSNWYSAVSHAGAVAALFDKTGHALVYDAIAGLSTWRFDIGIPTETSPDANERLRAFCARLGGHVKMMDWWHNKQYQSDIVMDIRILVTRYPQQNGTKKIRQDEEEQFQKELAESANLQGGKEAVQVVFLPVTSAPFNQGHASAVLLRRGCRRNDSPSCIVAIMDVDMDMGPTFFRNCMALVKPGVSMYSPIIWSEFNPQTSQLVNQMFITHEGKSLPKFSPHMGAWIDYGFGMYAMSGSDAMRILGASSDSSTTTTCSTSSSEFIQKAAQELHVIRRRDVGLTHYWHLRDCELEENDKSASTSVKGEGCMRACLGSLAHLEGSHLGQALRMLKLTDPSGLDALLYNENNPKPPSDEEMVVQAPTSTTIKKADAGATQRKESAVVGAETTVKAEQLPLKKEETSTPETPEVTAPTVATKETPSAAVPKVNNEANINPQPPAKVAGTPAPTGNKNKKVDNPSQPQLAKDAPKAAPAKIPVPASVDPREEQSASTKGGQKPPPAMGIKKKKGGAKDDKATTTPAPSHKQSTGSTAGAAASGADNKPPVVTKSASRSVESGNGKMMKAIDPAKVLGASTRQPQQKSSAKEITAKQQPNSPATKATEMRPVNPVEAAVGLREDVSPEQEKQVNPEDDEDQRKKQAGMMRKGKRQMEPAKAKDEPSEKPKETAATGASDQKLARKPNAEAESHPKPAADVVPKPVVGGAQPKAALDLAATVVAKKIDDETRQQRKKKTATAAAKKKEEEEKPKGTALEPDKKMREILKNSRGKQTAVK